MAKVVLVTGCSTGVGKALSVILAKSSSHSYRVYATMRNTSKQDSLVKDAGETLNKNLFIKQLDVCDCSSVEAVVGEILKTEGKIDILVNNAGVGLSGPLEGFTIKEAKDNFETNYFGVFRMIKAVLPSMKSHNSGQIINVSSMGGVRGVPFNDIYCSAKFAVEGLSESLAPALRLFNIKINLIEPGPIFTDFVQNAMKESHGGEADNFNVDDKTKKILKAYKEKMMAGFSPQIAETSNQCAEKIVGVIESENPPFRLQTNKNYIDNAKAKLTDLTGNSNVDQSYQIFFAGIEKSFV